MVRFLDAGAAYAWLDGHINYERQLDRLVYDDRAFELEDFRRRLGRLGDPHLTGRAVHIAGTRGKGSAALALEALLRASGVRTATYTSPHLREYRERVRIDGAPLAGDRFAALMEQLAALEGAEGPEGGMNRQHFKTVFENLTALFFLAANEADAEWRIVETGLGGRLDATNVLPPGPVLLTRIGLEHTHLLGDTIGAIAGEKAAILKPGGWGVFAAQGDLEAERVFRARGAETATTLVAAGGICPLREVRAGREGLEITFMFEGKPLEIKAALFGAFVAENMQNALAMLSCLRIEGLIPLAPREALAEALGGLKLPGRMERVCREPEVFADGAHCPTGAAALAETMRQHFGEAPAGLFVGMMREKDHAGFFREAARWPGWRWVRCYTPPGPRALPADELAAVARQFFTLVTTCENPETWLQKNSLDAEKIERVVAAGTLYGIAALEDWGAGQHGKTDSTEQNTA